MSPIITNHAGGSTKGNKIVTFYIGFVIRHLFSVGNHHTNRCLRNHSKRMNLDGKLRTKQQNLFCQTSQHF
jgi:hypothetical protein